MTTLAMVRNCDIGSLLTLVQTLAQQESSSADVGTIYLGLYLRLLAWPLSQHLAQTLSQSLARQDSSSAVIGTMFLT